MKSIYVVLVALIGTSTSIFAFDGGRQGFLLGSGAGTSSITSMHDADSSGELESQSYSNATTNFRIGYAPQDNYAILLYGHGLYNDGRFNLSYMGINYQRWSPNAPQSNSWFGGIGLMALDTSLNLKDESSDPETGLGVNFGYGREIVKHASLETNLTIGVVNETLYVGFTNTFHLLGY